MDQQLVTSNFKMYHIAIDGRTLCGRDTTGWHKEQHPTFIDGDVHKACPRCGKPEAYTLINDELHAQDKAAAEEREEKFIASQARRELRHRLGDDIKNEIFSALKVEGHINPVTGFATFFTTCEGEKFEVEIRVR